MTATATSLLDATIPVGDGFFVNGLWHCFGADDRVKVDRKTAKQMLDASGTLLLPINTHADQPTLGHGDVSWDSFQPEAKRRRLVPCLNINRQTSCHDAVERAERFRDQTGISLLKLEVLNADMVTSDDQACVEATVILHSRGFVVMPLVSNDYQAAWMVSDRSPLIRVMGSSIGSGLGIIDPDGLEEIVALGVPVILDGGVATVAHAKQALELGCAGFLVNSCLFDGCPADNLRVFREACA